MKMIKGYFLCVFNIVVRTVMLLTLLGISVVLVPFIAMGKVFSNLLNLCIDGSDVLDMKLDRLDCNRI